MVEEVARGAQQHDLAGPGVAADADLRVHARVGVLRLAGEDDDAHGVLAAHVVRDGHGLLDVVRVRVDDQGQDAAERDGAALLAQAHEVLGHVSGRRVGQVDDHA